MTELSSTQLQEIRTKVLGAAAKVPGALIGLGILFIVLGMIGIYGQVFFSFLSVNILGVFLFAGGILQGVHAFQSSGWKSVSVQIIFAIIYIVGAIYVWAFPIPALEVITLWMAAIFFVTGVLRLISAFQHRQFGEWIWMALSAVVSIVLGILIMNGFPTASLWLPGFLIAIELLLQGWSLLFLGLAARSLAKSVANK
jgi:uncharacterized membrane protein HdeD (DUF308 family)